jgi:hypothetical protein
MLLNYTVWQDCTPPCGNRGSLPLDGFMIRSNNKFLIYVHRLQTRALHWVPIPMPMPMGVGWAWVRCYCSWVGLGGHRFCASLYPAPNRSQTSRMHRIR